MNIDAQCGDILYIVAFSTKELKSAAVRSLVVGITTTERLETKGSIDKKLYDLQVIDGCGLLQNDTRHCYAADVGYLFTNKKDAEKAAKEELEKAVFRGSISRLKLIMEDIEAYKQDLTNRISDMQRELDNIRKHIKTLTQEA